MYPLYLIAQSLLFLMNLLGSYLTWRSLKKQSFDEHATCSPSSWPLLLGINHVPAQDISENSSCFCRESTKNCIFLWHWETMYDYNKNPLCEKIQVIWFCLGLITASGNSGGEVWAGFTPNMEKPLPLPKGYLKCIKAIINSGVSFTSLESSGKWWYH